MKPKKERIVFYILIVFIDILVIEAVSQILFFVHKGYFLFQRRPSEIFNVREFSVVTNDARGFTGIPNYINPNHESWVSWFDSFRLRGWFLSFDSFGFRRGKQTESSSSQSNIVFLGDSVPFGWGVSDNSSLPSQFFERLQGNALPYGVVNAALPSYALAQAVARYEQEIHSRLAVDTVYLQIYDPASQLALRGPRWQPSDNWMNYPYVSKSFLSRHSAAMAIVQGFASRLNMNLSGAQSQVEIFDPSDAATTRRLHAHVRAELARLLALSKTDGVRRLLIAPITIPAQSLDGYYSRSRQAAIALVNQDLRDFANSHNNEVVFVDTISLLRRYPDTDVFIDRCCHLSERGNGIVADYLMTLLLDSGHFSQNRVPEKM